MKIIDTHTHFPGRSLGSLPRSIETLREEFVAEGLSAAWLFTTDGLLRNSARQNDILAEAVRDHRDFFIPFCTVDPHEGEEAALRELDRAKSQLGMKGVKFHPWLQAFSLAHPAMPSILRRAGELGLPVVFHDGTPPYSSPLQIAAAAEKAPGTTIILGHAGLDELAEDAVLACRRHANIYLCCCSGSAGVVAEVIRRCPPERLLFGSDGGFLPMIITLAIEKIRAACESADLLRKILYENPRRLIAMEGQG